MPQKILTFPELKCRGVLLGRRQIDRLEAEGKFPRRVHTSAGRVGWLVEEIDTHVEDAIRRRSPRPSSTAHGAQVGAPTSPA